MLAAKPNLQYQVEEKDHCTAAKKMELECSEEVDCLLPDESVYQSSSESSLLNSKIKVNLLTKEAQTQYDICNFMTLINHHHSINSHKSDHDYCYAMEPPSLDSEVETLRLHSAGLAEKVTRLSH
ncbi:uncharacterized protein [Ptychodera flava]